MKKILISLVIVLMIIMHVPVSAKTIGDLPEKTDHEKVNIHLFYASWCSHCHDFITYFSDKYEDYKDYFEIKTYLVSETQNGQSVTIPENYAIMESVAAAYGKEMGFPLIIVGDEFAQSGFGNDGTEIINKALEEYQNEKYEDKVSSIVEKEKLDDSKIADFEDACSVAGIACGDVEAAPDYSAVILIGVFVVLVGGLSLLVIISKK